MGHVVDKEHTIVFVAVDVEEEAESQAEYRSDSALSAPGKGGQCTARDRVFLRKRREPRQSARLYIVIEFMYMVLAE